MPWKPYLWWINENREVDGQFNGRQALNHSVSPVNADSEVFFVIVDVLLVNDGRLCGQGTTLWSKNLSTPSWALKTLQMILYWKYTK